MPSLRTRSEKIAPFIDADASIAGANEVHVSDRADRPPRPGHLADQRAKANAAR